MVDEGRGQGVRVYILTYCPVLWGGIGGPRLSFSPKRGIGAPHLTEHGRPFRSALMRLVLRDSECRESTATSTIAGFPRSLIGFVLIASLGGCAMRIQPSNLRERPF
ncbi:hypothetical protein NEOLEDRAFT_801271 [Neolentinus lepideus HHB14362 ss-1]|uniref:Uncharacterized protein n=1 Tax=Neolentinus lepideus HHB14362 ss-1 TaxID=1314782 RepID=A0A165PI00_9AGAM|nr:hypothetical protein NEOLEDRAFT_801271 [Neolentinus lepideus HHB14362 ss-1]